MAYVALRPFKYQTADGSMKQAIAGTALPEANTWKNVDRLVRRRWITMEDGQTWDGRQYRIPKGRPPKAAAKPAPMPKAEPDMYTESDLHKLLKSDVQAVATSLGLDTDGTKADLIGAILEAQDG